MNIKKRFATLAIAAALILGATASQAAQPGDMPPAYQMQPYRGLTPQQEQEAQKIFVDNYAEMEATRQALAGKRMELDQQLASPSPDKGKIERLSREIGELRGKMLSARADVRAKLNQKGLPPDYFGPTGDYGRPDGYGPCWVGPRGGWHRGDGWYHHGGHRGYGHGHRGGCWR